MYTNLIQRLTCQSFCQLCNDLGKWEIVGNDFSCGKNLKKHFLVFFGKQWRNLYNYKFYFQSENFFGQNLINKSFGLCILLLYNYRILYGFYGLGSLPFIFYYIMELNIKLRILLGFIILEILRFLFVEFVSKSKTFAIFIIFY